MEGSWDFRIVRYSVGVCYSGVFIKRGSTVAGNNACLIISHLPTQSTAKECNCRVSHVINFYSLLSYWFVSMCGESLGMSWIVLSFIPGIQIRLLIVVFILSALLGLTTTRMIYGLVSSGVTFLKLKEVDEPVWMIENVKFRSPYTEAQTYTSYFIIAKS